MNPTSYQQLWTEWLQIRSSRIKHPAGRVSYNSHYENFARQKDILAMGRDFRHYSHSCLSDYYLEVCKTTDALSLFRVLAQRKDAQRKRFATFHHFWLVWQRDKFRESAKISGTDCRNSFKVIPSKTKRPRRSFGLKKPSRKEFRVDSINNSHINFETPSAVSMSIK